MSPNESCKKNPPAASVVAERRSSLASCLAAICLGAALVAGGLSGATPAAAQAARIVHLQAVHSGKCAHVHGGSSANGAAITQWDCVNLPNVIWSFRTEGAGPDFLIAHNSGKCAHVHGGSVANGGRITQWDCINQPHLKWRLDPAPNGANYVVNVKSGKCMHVHGAQTGNGAQITQWDCVNLPHVQWKLVPVPRP